MKTGSLVLLIIMGIACFQAFSQSYDSLVVENAQWQVILDSDDPPWADEMSGWLLRGDTIINDLKYKKLFSRTFKEPYSEVIISQNLYGFLREEVENKRVYALESAGGGCDSSNAEYLLFDFSYEVGDTSHLCIHTEYLGSVVLSEKYMDFVYGKERNIFFFDGSSVALIEGIGHEQGLMESPIINISGGPSIYLFDYCRGTDEECNVIYVKVDENSGKNDFSIYPNPATDQIRIHFHNSDFQNHKEFRFSVNDIYGGKILEIYCPVIENDFNINTSFIPNGIYILTFVEESKVLAKKKLIIAR